jgi:hypothetical protein
MRLARCDGYGKTRADLRRIWQNPCGDLRRIGFIVPDDLKKYSEIFSNPLRVFPGMRVMGV